MPEATETKKLTVSEAIDTRWSPRAFASETIDEKILQLFFDSGRHVASSYNEQPWFFIVARKEDPHYDRLFECLNEFNQSWAHLAPVLVAGFSKMHFGNNSKTNAHRKYDLGAFVTAGTLGILPEGYYVHQMAGFQPETLVEHFNVDREYEPTVMFVIGKPGDASKLPEELEKKETPESPRKAVSDFVFGGEWGSSYFQTNNDTEHGK